MTVEFKPLARALVYGGRWRNARIRAALARVRAEPREMPLAFVVGCGRSGTTFLGETLGRHARIFYRNEPYHLWCAIAPESDVSQLYHREPGRCLMEAAHASPDMRRAFWRLMGPGRGSTASVLVEKTPYNAMRIGFLRALHPRARFVHIVRNGLDVVRSIEKLATTNSYRIGLRSDFNQWWGASDARWRHLSRDGADAGYFKDEVGGIMHDETRAAYEWLVSLLEVERWREALGPDLLELRYEDLIADCGHTFARVADFLGVEASPEWCADADTRVVPTRPYAARPLVLPERMCEAFNAFQRAHGFTGRAVLQGACPRTPSSSASTRSTARAARPDTCETSAPCCMAQRV